jgi:hypothetical protein
MGILRKSIFQPGEGNSLFTPYITPEDVISDPNIVHNAYLRSKISSNIIPESLPIPGITIDAPRKLTIEEQYMYENYIGLYNKYNAEVNLENISKYIPNTLFGCHVKLLNDGLPELSTLTPEKAKIMIEAHAFCIIDVTELSEYFEPQPGTVVYVQMLDEARTYGRIVAAQNYASGIAVTFAGQAADNFKGLVGLIGSGAGLDIGPKDNPLAYTPDLQAPESDNMESQGYYNAYFKGRYIGKVKVVRFRGFNVREQAKNALEQMLIAAESEGINLTLSSAFRTTEQQANLKEEKGDLAAETNRSNHQNGTAFDFNVSNEPPAYYDWLAANAQKYKFFRTVKREKWHWEYIPSN